MRLFVITVICALAACSLYEDGSSSITRSPPPDAGNHNCGDASKPLPDAGIPPDGYWIDDAPNYPDAGTYLPDAYLAPDAAH
jgi:hypothetical protein